MRHCPQTEGLELAAGTAGVEAVAHRAPVGSAESLEERVGLGRAHHPVTVSRARREGESEMGLVKTSERESGPR
jgi:hypothetical protein